MTIPTTYASAAGHSASGPVSVPRPGQHFSSQLPGEPTGRHHHPVDYGRAYRRLHPKPTFLSVLGEILITIGLFLMLFVVWELYWTNIDANRQADDYRNQAVEQFQDNAVTGFMGTGPDPSVPVEVVDGAGPWGMLYIPRLGEDWSTPIMDGVSSQVIDAGVVGRYPGSARPGEPGNVSVAGHRQTHGSLLWDMDQVVPGDRMYVQTANGWWVYEVREHKIVAPTAVEVLAPNPLNPEGPAESQWLTITTCHPLYTTRERMISHAEKVDFVPLSEGAPEEIADIVQEIGA